MRHDDISCSLSCSLSCSSLADDNTLFSKLLTNQRKSSLSFLIHHKYIYAEEMLMRSPLRRTPKKTLNPSNPPTTISSETWSKSTPAPLPRLKMFLIKMKNKIRMLLKNLKRSQRAKGEGSDGKTKGTPKNDPLTCFTEA